MGVDEEIFRQNVESINVIFKLYHMIHEEISELKKELLVFKEKLGRVRLSNGK